MRRLLLLVVSVILGAAIGAWAGAAVGAWVNGQRVKQCKTVPSNPSQLDLTWPDVQLVHEPDESESVRVTIGPRTSHGAFVFRYR